MPGAANGRNAAGAVIAPAPVNWHYRPEAVIVVDEGRIKAGRWFQAAIPNLSALRPLTLELCLFGRGTMPSGKRRLYKRFFDGVATHYSALSRYTPACIERCLSDLARSTDKVRPRVLDVGAGDGYPSRVFMGIQQSDVYLLDLSRAMLKQARARLTSRTEASVKYIQADATRLPFRLSTFDVAFACCMVHLVQDKAQMLEKLHEVLRSNGILCIITYDPKDLALQVVHRYFPGFLALDRRRHGSLEDLESHVSEAGFRIVSVQRFPYSFRFKTRDALVSFVLNRPFSGFAEYSDARFRKAFVEFRRRVCKSLPRRNLLYQSALTMIIARKPISLRDS